MVAGVPLMDLTRRVRTTPNVRVLPSALWTTPWTRPRTTILPSRLMNLSGTNEPVTERPDFVSPVIRETSLPWAVCATVRADDAAGADGALLAATPPEASAMDAVTTRATSRASGPETYLFLKLCMVGFPPRVLSGGRAGAPDEMSGFLCHARSAHPSRVHP